MRCVNGIIQDGGDLGIYYNGIDQLWISSGRANEEDGLVWSYNGLDTS